MQPRVTREPPRTTPKKRCSKPRTTSRKSNKASATSRSAPASLHEIVRKRALYAYTHAGNDIDVVIGADDPLSAARGKNLIDQANQKDNTAVKRLAGINSDLRDETTVLREEESKQRTEKERLDARNAEFEAALADAQSRDRRAPGEVRPGDRGGTGSGAQGGART